MLQSRSRACFACIPLAFSACSSSPVPETTGFTAPPLATSTSSSGSLQVEVRTSPQPPVESIMQAKLTITDAEGKPVDGLTFAVVPWMPAMGHGTSLVPTVKAMGEGIYLIDDLSLFMPGEWELRLTFNGSTADTANPVFDVQ